MPTKSDMRMRKVRVPDEVSALVEELQTRLEAINNFEVCALALLIALADGLLSQVQAGHLSVTHYNAVMDAPLKDVIEAVADLAVFRQEGTVQ